MSVIAINLFCASWPTLFNFGNSYIRWPNSPRLSWKTEINSVPTVDLTLDSLLFDHSGFYGNGFSSSRLGGILNKCISGACS